MNNFASELVHVVIKGFYLVIIQCDGVKCACLKTINIFARIAHRHFLKPLLDRVGELLLICVRLRRQRTNTRAKV